MSFDKTRQIVERQFPNMTVSKSKRDFSAYGRRYFVDSSSKSNFNNSSEYESNSPSLDDLKKKYLEKESYSDSVSSTNKSVSESKEKGTVDTEFKDKINEDKINEDEFDVVLIKPKQSSEADEIDHTRTVIVSKNNGVIGSQG